MGSMPSLVRVQRRGQCLSMLAPAIPHLLRYMSHIMVTATAVAYIRVANVDLQAGSQSACESVRSDNDGLDYTHR